MPQDKINDIKYTKMKQIMALAIQPGQVKINFRFGITSDILISRLSLNLNECGGMGLKDSKILV